MSFRCVFMALCLTMALAPGCDGTGDEPDPIHVSIDAECENINPEYCMLPWPSSRYQVADDSTATGWRLDYVAEAFPENLREDVFDVAPYNRLDGFPPSAQILTVFAEQITTTELPPWWDIDRSLDDDSPTVLLNMDTGERVAHFTETDVRYDNPEEILVYIRPAARLDENTRYAVAMRGLTFDSDGRAVVPGEVFVALRDGVVTDSDQVEARRPGLEEMFTALTDAGVDRTSLIQAWDFHTASGEMLWGDLLFARDDLYDRLGADGIGCTIDEVQDDYNDDIYRRVDGFVTVPLYMDSEHAGARLVRGADGKPEYQGDHEVAFTARIPRSLAEPAAGPVLTYGHGFFGSDGELGAGWLESWANDNGMTLIGTDWAGMSEYDVTTAAVALSNVSNFPAIPERLMQGELNFLALTRTLAGVCASEAAFVLEDQPVFDTDELYYMGMSQGGIMGTTLMALSQDIERGVLNVGASNYALMQSRSRNFDDYELIYAAWYEERIEREFYWSVMMSQWEMSDPVTFLTHVTADPFPDTLPKKILYQVGMEDAQVCNVASDMSIRTAGWPQQLPTNHEIWGVEAAPAAPYDGSVAQYWDCGAPAQPLGPEPNDDNEAHECVRRADSARLQWTEFLKPDGVVVSPCDGACDPE